MEVQSVMTTMRIAITRDVSPAIERCELTHLERFPIDAEVARAQHREYERCLEQAGCRVLRLDAAPDMPDSVFVEDVAVVFDEFALITRPGAESRRRETAAVARALGAFRSIRCIESPGTVDGGDVLVVGRRVFVGRSSRTNAEGVAQMRRLLEACGYTVLAVTVQGCLHLKSAVTALGDDVLLLNRQWCAATEFANFDLVDVHPEEPFAANALRIGDTVIYPEAFTRTRERLEERGLHVLPVPADELAKAEGGVTCCSLILTP